MTELQSPKAPGPILSDVFLSRLAYELATTLYDPEIVFQHFGIGSAYFAQYICYNPAFMAYYAEARAVWNSSDNAMHRFTRKAGIVLEDFLTEAHRLLNDPNSPMAPKVTLAQWLGRVAGAENVHPPVRNALGDGGVATQTVVINLSHGHDKSQKPIVLDNHVTEVLPEQVIPNTPLPNPFVPPPFTPPMPPVQGAPTSEGPPLPIAPTIPPSPGMRLAYPAAPMAAPAPVRSADGKPEGEMRFPNMGVPPFVKRS